MDCPNPFRPDPTLYSCLQSSRVWIYSDTQKLCGLIEKFVDQISSHGCMNNIKLEELKKACKTEEYRKIRARMEDSGQIVLPPPCVSLCCNPIHGKLDMDVPKKQPCNLNRLCQMHGCWYSYI